MKFILILIALISFISAPTLAIPSATTTLEAGEELGMVTQTAGKNIVLRLLNKKGATVQSVVVPATDRKTLGNYLPSVISKKLQGEKLKASGGFLAKVMTQKLLRFPIESAGFFAALGAVMSYQLIFHYAQNPVAYEQLYKSQMDPVGQLGFYFFMVGNGVSAEPLMHLVKEGKLNPKLAPFIPFFGMGVGFVASNIVHELGDAPNMWACARGLVTGKGLDTKSCDQAANTWYNRGGAAGIANQYAPSLLSLVGSTIASGLVQGGVSIFSKFVIAHAIKAGLVEVSIKVVENVTVTQLVRVLSVEVAALFVPGGIVIKGFRLVGFVAQLTVFSWLDEVMRRPIDFAYQNLTKGNSLQRMHDGISNFKKSLIKTNFNSPSSAGLDNLNKYGEAMAEWRQVNMSTILEAQANWEQALAKLSNSYNSTEVFYRDFTGYLRDKNFGRWSNYYLSGEETHMLDRLAPLYGVTPSDLQVPWKEISLSSPETIEKGQMVTVKKVVANIQTGKLFANKNFPKMSDENQMTFNKILKGLSSDNPVTVGQALQAMNKEIEWQGNPGSYCLDCSTPLQKYLKEIKKALGNPYPITIKGLAFANYYQGSQAMAEQIQKTQYPKSYSTSTLGFNGYCVSTPTFAESMIASMITGPDADRNESVVGISKGFAAIFRAPKITKDINLDFISSPHPDCNQNALNVFSSDIGAKTGGGKLHDSAFSYLSKDGIRTSVLNKDDDQSFEKWWDSKVENQYVRAWTRFESQYQQNVAQMVLRLWNSGQSIWNRGGTPNGVLASIDFENQSYLDMLKEMALAIAPQKNSKYQIIQPVQYSDKAPYFSKWPILKNLNPWSQPILWPSKDKKTYTVIQQKSSLLNANTTKQPLVLIAKPNQELATAIQWESDIRQSMNKLKSTLGKIRAAHHVNLKNPNEILTISNLSNEEIQTSIKNVTASIKKASIFFSRLNLNKQQDALVKVCLQGLLKTSNEINNYALIANSVSYRARADKKGWISNRCQNLMKNSQKTLGVSFIKKVAECE